MLWIILICFNCAFAVLHASAILDDGLNDYQDGLGFFLATTALTADWNEPLPGVQEWLDSLDQSPQRLVPSVEDGLYDSSSAVNAARHFVNSTGYSDKETLDNVNSDEVQFADSDGVKPQLLFEDSDENIQQPQKTKTQIVPKRLLAKLVIIITEELKKKTMITVNHSVAETCAMAICRFRQILTRLNKQKMDDYTETIQSITITKATIIDGLERIGKHQKKEESLKGKEGRIMFLEVITGIKNDKISVADCMILCSVYLAAHFIALRGKLARVQFDSESGSLVVDKIEFPSDDQVKTYARMCRKKASSKEKTSEKKESANILTKRGRKRKRSSGESEVTAHKKQK